jgi:hypothetical protein
MAQTPTPGKQVRSESGRLLGVIEDLPDGKQGIRDALGNLRGHYDPKKDETINWRGRRVGGGNLLESLVGAKPIPTVRVLATLKRLQRMRRE